MPRTIPAMAPLERLSVVKEKAGALEVAAADAVDDAEDEGDVALSEIFCAA
jgi:hypothetical protein